MSLSDLQVPQKTGVSVLFFVCVFQTRLFFSGVLYLGFFYIFLVCLEMHTCILFGICLCMCTSLSLGISLFKIKTKQKVLSCKLCIWNGMGNTCVQINKIYKHCTVIFFLATESVFTWKFSFAKQRVFQQEHFLRARQHQQQQHQ